MHATDDQQFFSDTDYLEMPLFKKKFMGNSMTDEVSSSYTKLLIFGILLLSISISSELWVKPLPSICPLPLFSGCKLLSFVDCSVDSVVGSIGDKVVSVPIQDSFLT